MTARIIDGSAVSRAIRGEVAGEVRRLKQLGITPCLAAVLVGDVAASKIYVRNKRNACAEVGMQSVLHTLPADVPQEALLSLIDELNEDRSVHGILVQLPLPDDIDETAILERVSPEKDVDGFHPVNVGKLVIGLDAFRSCTPAGVQELLARSRIDVAGKHVVILGRSNVVGKPMANILLQKGAHADATVTICHSRTKNLPAITHQADILIAAMGRPRFVNADMVREGVVVVDVGINRVADPGAKKGYRLVGDVDFDSVSRVAAAITPVPGGVGPMTVAMLMVNTLKAARASQRAGAQG